MTLVSEAGPLSDLGERLVGPSHQGLRPLRSALEDVSLGTDTNCLLKGATEVIGAETCHSSQIDQDQSIIQMGLDVIPHPLQAFAGKPVRRLEHKRRLIGKTARNLHRECRIQCVGEDTIDETTIDLMGIVAPIWEMNGSMNASCGSISTVPPRTNSEARLS